MYKSALGNAAPPMGERLFVEAGDVQPFAALAGASATTFSRSTSP
jgi:hypothetical protein